MNGLLIGNVARPQAVEVAHSVPASSAYEGSTLPFDLRHAGAWEFLEPGDIGEPGKFHHSPDPIPGAHRTWSVAPLRKDGEWVAVIDDFRYNPGANGCKETGVAPHVRLDVKGHILGMQSKPNVVVIQDGKDPRMGPYTTFRAWFPYEGGGRFYCYIGVSLRPLGATGRAIPEPDRGWELGMRRHAVAAGVVPPMDISVLDLHVKMLSNRLVQARRAAEAGKLHPEMLARREAGIADLIRRMKDAWHAQFAGDDTAGGPLLHGERGDAGIDGPDGAADPDALPAPPPTSRKSR